MHYEQTKNKISMRTQASLFYAVTTPTLLLSGCATPTATPTAKPNVIVILADDLGYGDLGVYGGQAISTPNLDKLASEGVCFNNGYATSATSTPSRYALFTGMYPWKNKDAAILPGDAPLLIGVDQFTMPKMMQSNGYTTAAIGKWHLGMGMGTQNWNERVVPGANEIGFDYSCLIAATNDRVPTVFVENGNVVGLEASDPISISYTENFDGEPTALTNPEMLKMTWHHGHNNSIVNGIPRIGFMKGGEKAKWVDEDMADYFVGKVVEFIDENKDKPFFLYYGLHQPHVPRTPHSRFVGSTTLGPRGDAIVEADWCVGELIAKLESEGLLENTLIIFSSDNGPVLNDGYNDGAEEMLGDHNPMGGLRGGKYSLFDAGTHVPFFTYWKDHIESSRSDVMVSQLDIVASVASLVGAEVPAGLDSDDQLDVFLGKSQNGRDKYVTEAMGRLAYRSGQYVVIPPYAGRSHNETGNELGNVAEFALYDLQADPTQKHDIAKENPELLESLKAEFFALTKGYYTAQVDEVELK